MSPLFSRLFDGTGRRSSTPVPASRTTRPSSLQLSNRTAVHSNTPAKGFVRTRHSFSRLSNRTGRRSSTPVTASRTTKPSSLQLSNRTAVHSNTPAKVFVQTRQLFSRLSRRIGARSSTFPLTCWATVSSRPPSSKSSSGWRRGVSHSAHGPRHADPHIRPRA